ncbi:MAG: HEPN domain-containing protein [Lachnospiraceae bacterium]|nr:HEPN domain-containing protein [Lachnospiraceae bacterium]
MQHNEKDLSQYRIERAKEDLRNAYVNYENKLFKGAVNRAYYAIFHSIRAVNILDGFDASKHSSVIAYFNRNFVHTGKFEIGTYKIIDSAYRIREKCDYSDVYIVSKEEAFKQIEKADTFIKIVEKFLKFNK